jgi:adenosylmethionine-8-amino-7-oxononanoate aminotransferase
MARGLMVYLMGGTIDVRLGDHVLLAPPFIVEEGHLDLIVDRLEAAVGAAIATLASRSKAVQLPQEETQ